jgi:hypothetical protein
MLPPVPVMTQTFPDNLGDIRIPPLRFGGFPSWVAYTPVAAIADNRRMQRLGTTLG